MSNDTKDILNELQRIKDNHGNIINDYDVVLSNYSCKRMSVGACIYGMYFPERQLEKYFEYHGKLTQNDKKKDFVYYFDENDKLILTERYSDGAILNVILFYYYQDSIEIVWYCMQRKKINIVGKITYKNDVLEKFIESGDVVRGVNSFREYIFDTNDEYIYTNSYMKYSKDKEIVRSSKMRKNN